MRNNIQKRLQALEQPENEAKGCNELVILQHNETMAGYRRLHPEFDPDKITLVVKINEK